jgi:hypothetical protein
MGTKGKSYFLLQVSVADPSVPFERAYLKAHVESLQIKKKATVMNCFHSILMLSFVHSSQIFN